MDDEAEQLGQKRVLSGSNIEAREPGAVEHTAKKTVSEAATLSASLVPDDSISNTQGASSRSVSNPWEMISVPLPEMTPDRTEAILRGVIPVYDISMAAAYGLGVTSLRSTGINSTRREELKPAELCGMLVAGGQLRALAVNMMLILTKSAKEGNSGASQAISYLISVGCLSVLCLATKETAFALLSESSHTISPNLSLLMNLSDLLQQIFCEQILPKDKEVNITLTACIWFGDAIAFTLRDTLDEDIRGTAIASTELTCASKLKAAYRSLYHHPQASEEYMTSGFTGELCSVLTLKAIFEIMNFPGKHIMSSNAASQVLRVGTNCQAFYDNLISKEVDGIKIMIDMISGTSLDDQTVQNLLVALVNISSKPGGCKLILDNDGLLMLQPSILSGNKSICLATCEVIANLAFDQSGDERITTCGVIEVIEEQLQMITPGSINRGIFLDSLDILNYQKVLTPDSLDFIKLSSLHGVASNLTGNLHHMKSNSFITALRSCANTSNPFLYQVSTYILTQLDLPVPAFRPNVFGKGKLDLNNVEKWSIDEVCEWVGKQSFKSYRHIFRESYTNGRLLLSLDDSDLKDMGIDHKIHRRAALFAISDLRGAPSASASGGAFSSNEGCVGTLSRQVSDIQNPDTFDVFISYRRVGGADFAHFLKLMFEKEGKEVFLDIDNLGSGKFDDKLYSSLSNSKNVILVWSKGCMDRFLDNNDFTNQDFVRAEYKLAIKLGKNIIPVYKEDFEFPHEDQLPDDVKAILSYNAIKYSSEYREHLMDKIKKLLLA